MSGSHRVVSALRVYLSVFIFSVAAVLHVNWLFGRSLAGGLRVGLLSSAVLSFLLGTGAIMGHRGRSGPISPRQRIVFRTDVDIDRVRDCAEQLLAELALRPVEVDEDGTLSARPG